jgi:hypothetical protein
MPDLIPSTESDHTPAENSQSVPDTPLIGFINNLRRHLELQQQREPGNSESPDPDSDLDTPKLVRLLTVDQFRF